MVFGRKRSPGKYQPQHDVEWLVAGLGNPGPEYADTPHNIGFLVVDAIASAHRIALVSKHQGLYGAGNASGGMKDVALLKPLTFMNLSGRSVKPAMAQHGLKPDHLLAVHDEIDLPFGTLQLKFGGGFAGHNGLKSINESLGTRDFARLRVGVGRPGPGDNRPIKDWILSSWDQTQGEVEQLVEDAVAAVDLVLRDGLRRAMSLVNSGSR